MLNKITYLITMLLLVVALFNSVAYSEDTDKSVAFFLLWGFLILYGVLLTLNFIRTSGEQRWNDSSRIYYNVLIGLVTIVAAKISYHYVEGGDFNIGPIALICLLQSIVASLYFASQLFSQSIRKN